MNEGYRKLVADHLRGGEELLVATNAVPAKGARGVSVNPIGAAIGNTIARAGSVKGEKDGIAAGIPSSGGSAVILAVTDGRVGIWKLDGSGELWSVDRTDVAGVEKTRRLQLLARYRLHFTDGSSAAVMTPSAKSIDALQDALGVAG